MKVPAGWGLAAALLLAEALRAEVPALFFDAFEGSDGLVAAESNDVSALWRVTSGALSRRSGEAWSDSAVFRVVTKRADFGNVLVAFDAVNESLGSSGSTPPVAWDGLHIFLRYQSPYWLYTVTFNRRDGKVVIKKKVPGGSSNDGTYHELSAFLPHVVAYGARRRYAASAANNADGSVTIELYADGVLLARATDDGRLGGAPITAAGRTGVRGDNAVFRIDGFTVTEVPGSPTTAPTAPPSAPPEPEARAPQRFLSPSLADGVNDAAFFGPGAQEVVVFNLNGRRVFEASRRGQGGTLNWNGRDGSGRLVDSGVYVARIKRPSGAFVYQSIAVAK